GAQVAKPPENILRQSRLRLAGRQDVRAVGVVLDLARVRVASVKASPDAMRIPFWIYEFGIARALVDNLRAWRNRDRAEKFIRGLLECLRRDLRILARKTL